MSEAVDTTIEYRSEDGIAVITLNRPERLNALLPGMGERYAELLRQADDDPGVRAIVVTGAGRGFCSGADLSVLAEGAQALTGYAAAREGLPTVALSLRTPVVTAINGPCAGIGFVLAICADVRFASPTAVMSTSFSRLGLIAEYGSAWLLTRLVGLAHATDILLSGRSVSADEAARIGLVTAVDDDPLARAMSWARDVADHCSPTSLAVIKGQLLAVDRQSLDEAVDVSLVEMLASFQRPDLPEAIAARLAKRPPEFAPRD
jgi:enoyl-CoA hydratase/carnithine racemase